MRFRLFKRSYLSFELVLVGAILLTFGALASNEYIFESKGTAVQMDDEISRVFGTSGEEVAPPESETHVEPFELLEATAISKPTQKAYG